MQTDIKALKRKAKALLLSKDILQEKWILSGLSLLMTAF
jgi:hypothetical protein